LAYPKTFLLAVGCLDGEPPEELKYWAKLGGGPYFFETIAADTQMGRCREVCEKCPVKTLKWLMVKCMC
jgi:hypothetical protein